MEFEQAPAGLRIVLRVREAPPNRAEVGAGFTEWEKARGSVRLKNRSTLGFGEETELLLAGSDAESQLRLGIRGDRLLVAGLGYRADLFAIEDKPHVFDAEGAVINRADFHRRGIDARLQVGLERWGLLEAGLVFGSVRTAPRAGLDYEEATDDVGAAFGAVTIDTLDDARWPAAGARLAARAEWGVAALGADRRYWRLRVDGRRGRRLGGRLTLQLDGLLGLSGEDLPAYDQFRLGGPSLVPGYRYEELQGPQAVAGGLTLRVRLLGRLHAFARGGAGNVFASGDEIGLDGLRWGAVLGTMLPSRIGPVSLELGVREGGHVAVQLPLAVASVGGVAVPSRPLPTRVPARSCSAPGACSRRSR
jgi:outer membrane protein assembly factor BamA